MVVSAQGEWGWHCRRGIVHGVHGVHRCIDSVGEGEHRFFVHGDEM